MPARAPRRSTTPTSASSSSATAGSSDDGCSRVSVPAASNMPHPGVELAGELREGRAQPVGPQRGERDRALRGEGPAAPRVRLRGDRLGTGAGDRDERRAVGHLEQRHPLGAARVGQQRRDAVAHHLGAEAESDHAAGREPAHVARGRRDGSSPASWNCVPVVSSARPSDRNGVGSARSELCTHRSGRSRAPVSSVGASPSSRRCRSRRPSSARRVGASAAVSMRISDRCTATYGYYPQNVHRGACGRGIRPPTLATMSTSAPTPFCTRAAIPLGGPTLPQERRMVTSIPGPRSQELLARKAAAVAAGVGHTVPIQAVAAGGGVVVDADGNSLIDLGVGHRRDDARQRAPQGRRGRAGAGRAVHPHVLHDLAVRVRTSRSPRRSTASRPATTRRRARCSTPAPRPSRTPSRSPASTPRSRRSSPSTTATTAARTSRWR